MCIAGYCLKYSFNNVVLPPVAAFLGIIIDDKLSWKPHIQSVTSKLGLYSVLSIMYKAWPKHGRNGSFFYVADYLIEERRRWPVITASPRGQCSN